MEINLNQAEIEKGIKLFIAEEGIDLRDQEVTISLTGGKKPHGFRATVELHPAEDKTAEPVPDDGVEEPGIPFTYTTEEPEDD